MRPRIKQGTTRVIRSKDIVDGVGAPLTVTGWTVIGVARRNHRRGALLATWSTTPTGGQGLATASGREVTLTITPAMSTAWGECYRVVIQAVMINPAGTLRERIIDRMYDFDREMAAA